MRISWKRAMTAAALLVMAGCGGSTSPYGEGDDTSTDLAGDGADVLPDATPDAIPDPTPDPGADPIHDTIPDPTTDPLVDTGADVLPDPSPDLTPDGPDPDLPPPEGNVGDPCRMDGDCMGVPSDARVCMSDFMGYVTLPGGYCTASCTSDAECGPLGECVSFYGAGEYCLRTCTAPYDCRVGEGYSCSELPGGMGDGTYCLPPFSSDDGPSDY